jgi:hypothetical protein
VQHFSNDYQHHGKREGRANWQQGFAEPFISKVQEERLDGRIPQPAQQNWRRPGHDDHGYGGDLQGGYEGYGGDQQGDEQLAIITRSVRVEFPTFDGNDPSRWIYKANKFFHVHKTSYNQKLLLASIHMEGKALVWFQDMEASGSL